MKYNTFVFEFANIEKLLTALSRLMQYCFIILLSSKAVLTCEPLLHTDIFTDDKNVQFLLFIYCYFLHAYYPLQYNGAAK